jgi:hypothetical protein
MGRHTRRSLAPDELNGIGLLACHSAVQKLTVHDSLWGIPALC